MNSGDSFSKQPNGITGQHEQNVELRNLEEWHDEDEKSMDENLCKELMDVNGPHGWSADEMFKYNEKIHKVNSTYNEATLNGRYTTPLPTVNCESTVRNAAKLAEEIERKVMEEGRVTPESSDDDELFEYEHKVRLYMHHKAQRRLHQLQKQQKDLNQKKMTQRQQQQNQQRVPSTRAMVLNNGTSKRVDKLTPLLDLTKCSSKSFSVSSSLNHNIIKPVTSSSRNILRSCLA